MKALPYSFIFFTLSGVWRPLSWSSGWKKNTYDFYSLLVLVIMYSFGFLEFIDVLQCLGKIEELVGASFMLVTVCNICYKAINLLNKRRDIINSMEILDTSWCQRVDSQEEKIHSNFLRRIRNTTGWYFCIVEGAVVMITLSSVMKNIPEHTLPFRVWLPFNYTNGGAYWFAYYHQSVAHALVATIGVGYDTFVPGIMLLTCEQLQIHKYRYETMIQNLQEAKTKKSGIMRDHVERNMLNDLIHHHKMILKFSESFSDIFSTVLFIQYLASSLVICLSVYRLAGMNFDNPEYPFAVFYLVCMTTQIFYYCWYGNELIIESLEIGGSVYQMEWSLLRVKTQKDLLIIMNRTTSPIVYTGCKIVNLSLDSFTRIMKLSYTVFNVLQRT